ncbi:hypothetical protein BC827DRAFT_922428 [Russula dissimulans]|nr:hypothetical protein BC827DRAFT_922428 [Russula dissimulans]
MRWFVLNKGYSWIIWIIGPCTAQTDGAGCLRRSQLLGAERDTFRFAQSASFTSIDLRLTPRVFHAGTRFLNFDTDILRWLRLCYREACPSCPRLCCFIGLNFRCSATTELCGSYLKFDVNNEVVGIHMNVFQPSAFSLSQWTLST